MEEVPGSILTGDIFFHKSYLLFLCKPLVPTLPTLFNYDKTRFIKEQKQLILKNNFY